jgi:hypothetical protein
MMHVQKTIKKIPKVSIEEADKISTQTKHVRTNCT